MKKIRMDLNIVDRKAHLKYFHVSEIDRFAVQENNQILSNTQVVYAKKQVQVPRYRSRQKYGLIRRLE